MKKLALFICLTLVSGFAFSQWTWQNPLPQGKSLLSVFFTDENTGYSAGAAGTIIKTTDGGETYTIQSSGTTRFLRTIFFVDQDNGYAVGDSGTIVKTSDGGKIWSDISIDTEKPSFSVYFIRSVYFTDVNTGYIVGAEWSGDGHDYGIIKKTIDGGLTWVDLLHEPDYWLNTVIFTDVNTGYIAGQGGDRGIILKTTDAGKTWTKTLTEGGGLFSAFFLDANIGYIRGDRIMQKTIDGGNTWEGYTDVFSFQSIYFTDVNTGYAVVVYPFSEIGHIFKTINGGINWDEIFHTSVPLSSVFFTNANTGYAVGAAGIIAKTNDAGINWTTPSIIYTSLYDVCFIDANTGYAVGDDGVFLKTINGGSSWNANHVGSNLSFNSVFFVDQNTGYLVDDGNRSWSGSSILKTIDGGNTWTILSIGTTVLIRSVFFTDTNTGYAVGLGHFENLVTGPKGIILKTIDGGTTWFFLSTGTTPLLSSVSFTDAKTGYAVGESGTILKTQDEGLTWTSIVSGTSSNLTSVYFPDANTGYAVGDGPGFETIIKTSDKGNTWTTLDYGEANIFSSVYFIDSNIGYAAGSGSVLKTINGGLTWTALPLNYIFINAVHFTDTNTGYLVGSGGTILKTTNGGINFIEEPVSLESTFSIYPNPAIHKISIATNSNLQGETTIFIFNMNGAILQQAKFQSQNLIEMDVSAFSKGIYLLKIKTKSGAETNKLVVQ